MKFNKFLFDSFFYHGLSLRLSIFALHPAHGKYHVAFKSDVLKINDVWEYNI